MPSPPRLHQNRVKGGSVLKPNLVVSLEIVIAPAFFPFPLLLSVLPLMGIVNWSFGLPRFIEGVVPERL